MAEASALSRIGGRPAGPLSEGMPDAASYNPARGLLSREEFERCLAYTAHETGHPLDGSPARSVPRAAVSKPA